MPKIYHGSRTPNLKIIEKSKSGYVHATPDLTFAAIFCGKGRNTIVSKWWKDENNHIYFMEIKEGCFDDFYKNQPASIYVLKDTNFYKKEGMSPLEKVSEEIGEVEEEIKIEDLKSFLLKQKDFTFIPYSKRKEYDPDIDNKLDEKIKKFEDKYGKEKTRKLIEKVWPELLEK